MGGSSYIHHHDGEGETKGLCVCAVVVLCVCAGAERVECVETKYYSYIIKWREWRSIMKVVFLREVDHLST
jgi:hypothetical protein